MSNIKLINSKENNMFFGSLYYIFFKYDTVILII